MNCQQGDIAIVVRSTAGNDGAIVTCLRLASLAEKRAVCLDRCYDDAPVWVTDRLLKSVHTKDGSSAPPDNLAPDSILRPIRDNDGEDEILRLAGKPNTEDQITALRKAMQPRRQVEFSR